MEAILREGGASGEGKLANYGQSQESAHRWADVGRYKRAMGEFGWLSGKVYREIRRRYAGRFLVGVFSCGGAALTTGYACIGAFQATIQHRYAGLCSGGCRWEIRRRYAGRF